VQELIDRLQEFPPGAAVLLAFQPHWPLQYHIGDLCSIFPNATEWGVRNEYDDGDEEIEEALDRLSAVHLAAKNVGLKVGGKAIVVSTVVAKIDGEWLDGETADDLDDGEEVVYIGEGGQVAAAPYLPAAAATELGWGRDR